MNEVMNAIMSRRSTRGFDGVQLTEEELQTLIDAALAAPSGLNLQQWHFSVVQNADLLARFSRESMDHMVRTVPAGSRGRFEDPDYNLFYGAPTVFFISRPADKPGTDIDCGIAVQNIAIAAQSLGLGSVIIGMPAILFGTDRGPAYEKEIGIPEGYRFAIAIVVGHNTVTKEAHPIGEGKVNIVR